jgi:predicted N-formylglutamate amidohydrolase
VGADRPAWRPTEVLVTCEHAGHTVPPEYARLFADAGDLLVSHRGWDPGALGVALHLARTLRAPLMGVATTRLLVEANRSPGHPELFSRRVRALGTAERDRILSVYYLPHRRAVRAWVAHRIGTGDDCDARGNGGRVLHIGVHSFTDVLDGLVREVDIGLLFDPAREAESDLCGAWRAGLGDAYTGPVRLNEPYLGTDDGLTTALREEFPDGAYAGVEVEVRQGLLTSETDQRAFAGLLARTLPR